MNPTTTTNHCGYNNDGIRIAVIFPAIDRSEPTWYVANHRQGGYNVPIARWDTVEVAQ